MLDSGVSATALALAGAVLRGLNVLSGGAGDADCTGHGTFVAGIIAARPMPGSCFAGLAPQARILPVIVVGSGPTDSVTASALATGIRYAVSNGATVIDVSTATTPDSPRSAAGSPGPPSGSRQGTRPETSTDYLPVMSWTTCR